MRASKKSGIPIPKAKKSQIPKPGPKKTQQATQQIKPASRVEAYRSDATDTSHISTKTTKQTANKSKPYEEIKWSEIVTKVNSFLGFEILGNKAGACGVKDYVNAFNEIMKYYPEPFQLFIPPTNNYIGLKSILPDYLSVIGYPHTFRSYEQIGTPKANIQLFYSLHWMVSVLELDREAENTNASLAPGFDMNFFDLILKFYPRFMESQEQDDVLSDVANEIESLFNDRTNEIELERTELENKLADLHNQLTEFETNSGTFMADLRRKINEKDTEIQKLTFDINSSNHEISRYETEQEVLLRDLDIQKQQSANLDKEISELEKRASALDIDRESIERLSRESAEIARSLEAAKMESQELENKVKEAYDEIEGARGFIIDTFSEWNASASKYGFQELAMKPDYESNRKMLDDFHTFLLEKRPLKGAAESAEERIENELASLRAQKEKLEKEAATLSKDLPKFIPSKTKFDADDLQRKIRDLEAEEAQNQLRYKEEKEEAETRLREAQEAFENYQIEISTIFSNLTDEIKALYESY